MPQLKEVCNPLLPDATAVAEYIKLADAARRYTNRGPLVVALEKRLSELFGADENLVVATASGTAALEASILAVAGSATAQKPYALLPSYTFAATALAAERCGYTPYFLDVDPGTWALDPGKVARHARIAEAGVIIDVAPYGRMPDMGALESLRASAGVAVVVDAAAAFEQVQANPGCISATVPVCLSFHATKTFSTGEGGAVLWRNRPGLEAVVQAVNFGFMNSRECRSPGFNGKMSEYSAAVGLAMLDMLATRQSAYRAVSSAYRRLFSASKADAFGTLLVSPDVSSAYALVMAHDLDVARMLRARLDASESGWRRWYEGGLHAMAHFSDCPRDEMPVTADLGDRLLGLPTAPDIGVDEIAGVVHVLAPGCDAGSAPDPLPGLERLAR